MIERRREDGSLFWTCDGVTFTRFEDDGETVAEQRDATVEELARWFPDPVVVEEYNAQLLANQLAREAAIASLTDPITPPTVTGSTVATVKASADAAIKEVAAQTAQRLAAVAEVLDSSTGA